MIARADLQAAEKPRGHGGGRHRLADRCGEGHHLQLVLTPRFKSVAADEAVDIFDIFERSLYRPYLLDLDHHKRYDVVKGTNSSKFSSDEVDTKTVNGTPMAAYAVFAAPQDGATTFDVHIATGGRSSRRCRSSDDRRARRGSGALPSGGNRTADPEAVGAVLGTPSRPGHRS